MAKLTEELKRYNDNMETLNKNLISNTDEVSKLRTEVKLSRTVDEKNKKFLQDIIKNLLSKNNVQQNRSWYLVKEVVSWALKIGLAGFGVAITLKVFGVV